MLRLQDQEFSVALILNAQILQSSVRYQAEEGFLFWSAHWKDRGNLEYYNGSSFEDIVYDNTIAGLSRNVMVEKM